MDGISGESVLFITLDSCRYDTFEAARAPTLKSVGPLHKAKAPSHFTYGSHAAMFMGFTPGIPGMQQPILDPKFARLFKMAGAGFPGKGGEGYLLSGASIVDGFRQEGFVTLGTSSVGWFNPATKTSENLVRDFDEFNYFGEYWSIEKQVDWVERKLSEFKDRNVFVFLNAGETHVPYFHKGATWDPDENPCVPYQKDDSSAECRMRQVACLEHLDSKLEPIIRRFWNSTILLCADHGDCWGEDGLWEHGISHEMTLTVPLLVRLRGEPLSSRAT